MPVNRSAWIEWRRFSAALLALVGALNVAEGFIVLMDDEAFGADRSRVAFEHPLGWGRLTLLLGVLMLAVALWLAAVTTRVRSLAVPVVALHALIQLGVLAAYPVWALLMIAFDVVILFALTATPAGGAASSAPSSGVAGAMPAGSMPAGSMPAGSMPAGAVPAGSMPAGSMPAGSMPVGAAAGSVPVGAKGPVRRAATIAHADRQQYRPRHRLTGEPAPVAVPVAVPPSRVLPRGGAPIVGAISGRFPDAAVGA